jgi:hypothetical protein
METWPKTFTMRMFFVLYCVEQVTWMESLTTCNKTNIEDVQALDKTFPRSWIGGYVLATPWMIYTGKI